MLKFHQRHPAGAFLTVMATTVPLGEEKSYGRFIYNDANHGKNLSAAYDLDILHYTESHDSDLIMISSIPYPHLRPSNVVNCGVYLYTTQQMYEEPCYKDYADKYARKVAISKEDHQERSLSKQ